MKYFKYELIKYKPININDLIRVGNKNKDGGYVISKRQIQQTEILFGLGINYDWTFEEDFKKLNNAVKIFCYDFSVGESIYMKSIISSAINLISINSYTKEILNKRSPLPIFKIPFSNIKTYFNFKSFFKPEKQNFFIQKGISDVQSPLFITVKDMFAMVKNIDILPENSIYIKMDIEESEYDILEDILSYSSKINGLAIEFHNIKRFWNDFNYLLDLIKKDFEIIHVHGNNCCGHISGTEIPNFLELSFIKRSLLSADEINSENNKSYPLPELDKPNLPNRPDLKIAFN